LNGPTFHAGDTAEFSVTAPFAPCNGLVTVRNSGIITTLTFEMKDLVESTFLLPLLLTNCKAIHVPISKDFAPNVFVQIDVVGCSYRVNKAEEIAADAPRRPALASGKTEIHVTSVRHLNILS
jgi:hypothetical protein